MCEVLKNLLKNVVLEILSVWDQKMRLTELITILLKLFQNIRYFRSYRYFKREIIHFSSILHTCNAQEAYIQLNLIVLHSKFVLFTLRGNFWYQIYQNRIQKILCQLNGQCAYYHRLNNYLIREILRIKAGNENLIHKTFV